MNKISIQETPSPGWGGTTSAMQKHQSCGFKEWLAEREMSVASPMDAMHQRAAQQVANLARCTIQLFDNGQWAIAGSQDAIDLETEGFKVISTTVGKGDVCTNRSIKLNT